MTRAFSPTQIEKYLTCNRAWGYERLDAILKELILDTCVRFVRWVFTWGRPKSPPNRHLSKQVMFELDTWKDLRTYRHFSVYVFEDYSYIIDLFDEACGFVLHAAVVGSDEPPSKVITKLESTMIALEATASELRKAAH